MGIKFVKMAGAGNDFIVIDNRGPVLTDGLAEFARLHCRRRFDVGADGVVLVEPSAAADFRMRIFNADGSEAEMCGNASRCVARFAFTRGFAKRSMTFETLAGIIKAQVDADRVTIGMGEVGAVAAPATVKALGREWTVHSVEAGVPHAVIFVEDLEEVPVDELGRAIRTHRHFAPRGTNVNFVQTLGGNRVGVRTYERGVEAETLACGTGSIASAVVSQERKGVQGPPVEVEVRGGLLKVDFRKQDGRARDVRLTGDAVFVYEGELLG